MFLTNEKNSKFRYETKATTTLKIVCLFLVLACPLILFQVVIFNANRPPPAAAASKLAPASNHVSATLNSTSTSTSGEDSPPSELFEIDKQPLEEFKSEGFQQVRSVLRLRRSPANASSSVSESFAHPAHDGSPPVAGASSIDRIDREDQITMLADDAILSQNKTQNQSATIDEGSESHPQTLVMVSSKSGKFSELMPLDDLVVSPTSGHQALEGFPRQQTSVMTESPNWQQFAQQFADASSLPEQTKQESQNEVENLHPLELELPLSATNADLTALHSYHLKQHQLVDGGPPGSEGNAPDAEVAGLEQMPDSFEGLMHLGETESGLDAPEEQALAMQQDSSANMQVGRPISNENDNDESGAGDDDEDDDEAGDNAVGPEVRQALADTSPVSTMNRQITNPIPTELIEASGGDEGDESSDLEEPNQQQLLTAVGYPMLATTNGEDLKAAAGHHYGKKKKKVKKYKKKIIIKKKKKKKKLKKIKVIKYKKKKKVIIKKKKKKGHYPKKHHHDHGKYYMYAKVPKKKSWEFGFKKGNKKHWIERHEKGHKNKFKTKVKWFDKKSKGKGLHIWDYNHHDKKKKKHYG